MVSYKLKLPDELVKAINEGYHAIADNRCTKCNRDRLPTGEDACLGHLPGVSFACCGHGKGPGYITFENGTLIRFGHLLEVSHKGAYVFKDWE